MSDFILVEKYRPKTIDECILPQSIKKTLQDFVDAGELSNMLFTGPPGIGKTTAAKALCEQLGVDSYVINGSDEGRFLDTVRNTAKNFASTVSLTSDSKHKVIIIDEADNTTTDVQLLLRAFIEEFSANCRFIFTCNYKYKIAKPLHSRCTIIDFSINKRNKPTIAAEFFSRLNDILNQEKIKSDKKVVAELINKHFHDWRRVLNECQRYSVGGKIDSGILAAFNNVEIDQLTKILKEKNFSELRLWVTQNVTNDPESLFRSVYDSFFITMIPTSIPSAVLVLAKYSEYATKVADHEINTLACLTEIMAECSFK